MRWMVVRGHRERPARLPEFHIPDPFPRGPLAPPNHAPHGAAGGAARRRDATVGWGIRPQAVDPLCLGHRLELGVHNILEDDDMLPAAASSSL